MFITNMQSNPVGRLFPEADIPIAASFCTAFHVSMQKALWFHWTAKLMWILIKPTLKYSP